MFLPQPWDKCWRKTNKIAFLFIWWTLHSTVCHAVSRVEIHLHCVSLINTGFIKSFNQIFCTERKQDPEISALVALLQILKNRDLHSDREDLCYQVYNWQFGKVGIPLIFSTPRYSIMTFFFPLDLHSHKKSSNKI